MQAEGAQQRKAGDVEQTEAEAKGYVQGAIDQSVQSCRSWNTAQSFV